MKLEVKDMSCGGCASAITRAVTDADPAAKVDVDMTTRTVKIDSGLSAQRVAALIEAAGFHPMLSPSPAD
ncbi:heavy-metal-associated domain-containing protein [Paraburkholderia sp. MMS20-SJTN17]|uniref:Heavy-metal-associated domain-containing protein n=1 Tax=Paraburkholderia translucens TaxID=2886945 RepID=A0ABS8KGL5_9BURK|nr:heavy-metal-associated domain-containing protein [Paraburkholderia sp. MMS20-SJTN17]MCC8403926.1 heavy-metal-associated domain-containing protein [Paraburkholderia sp. MMS20-SJTN17]